MTAGEKRNTMVEEYIAKTQEEMKKTILDSLGLYTVEREYSPTGHFSREYPKFDNTEGINQYYRETKKTYPEIDDETFEKLQKIIQEKETLTPKAPVIEVKKSTPPLEFSVESSTLEGKSFAATFLKVIAWILWIVGLLIAVLSAGGVSTTSNYRASTTFELITFLSILVPYFVAGSVAMCLSELFKNISMITSRVAGYFIQEIKNKEP